MKEFISKSIKNANGGFMLQIYDGYELTIKQLEQENRLDEL